MLAKKGFDTESMQKSLDAIDFKATAEPLEFLPETDLEGYLESQHIQIIWSSIEEAKKEVIFFSFLFLTFSRLLIKE